MQQEAGKLSPKITDMIRLDHKAVMALFHKYEPDMNAARKRALVNTISYALGLHAELEQELVYPYLRPFEPELVEKSIPEHIEMFRRIIELRNMEASDARFDSTVRELIDEVTRHVEDEEKALLPALERVLPDKLHQLGAQMTHRRIALAKPVAGKVAWNAARAMPMASLALGAIAAIAGGAILRRALHT